ncbi:T9SS type A sorting domain-containing protein [Neolewinella litorea]|uniref:T9SS type A sorting domain-containing protein n=1 Tax=Neolewinella litorea TaxID=2562452 RepID=A0A4S4NB38_9BACT|nr:T9SS type A sorting domain-containing protein [Neolewinella litorea]THH36519.1 T9SS type A sorting domain-containing protein [Neolewinella litorea]
MKFIFFLLTLLTCWPLTAQYASALRVEPAQVSKQIVVDNLDEDFEDITSVVVTNNSGRTLQLMRETVSRPRPRAWSYRALDRVSRAAPYVLTETEQQNGRHISLGPGQSATFYVIMRPDGVTGSGTTELRFTDLTLPGTVLGTASITTTVTQQAAATPPAPPTATESRPTPTSVRLYPNPAVDKFFVESPRGVRIGRVEVTNTLGRQIRSFTGEAGTDGYDIESLPDGLYLISIFDDGGKKLKTLRLLHRQFGA